LKDVGANRGANSGHRHRGGGGGEVHPRDLRSASHSGRRAGSNWVRRYSRNPSGGSNSRLPSSVPNSSNRYWASLQIPRSHGAFHSPTVRISGVGSSSVASKSGTSSGVGRSSTGGVSDSECGGNVSRSRFHASCATASRKPSHSSSAS